MPALVLGIFARAQRCAVADRRWRIKASCLCWSFSQAITEELLLLITLEDQVLLPLLAFFTRADRRMCSWSRLIPQPGNQNLLASADRGVVADSGWLQPGVPHLLGRAAELQLITFENQGLPPMQALHASTDRAAVTDHVWLLPGAPHIFSVPIEELWLIPFG